MTTVTDFNGIKILEGPNTHPGSGPLKEHLEEIELFNGVLNNVKTLKPVMVEIGCFWALWSLIFRKRFPEGKNVIMDLGLRQLRTGVDNFILNKWNAAAYHGGLFIEDSNTLVNREADLEYDKKEGEEVVGKELDLLTILDYNDIYHIDVFHADIQGSEIKLLEYLRDKKLLPFINNIVIATHSDRSHDQCLSLLKDFTINNNQFYGSLGGDGYIYASQ